MSKAWAAGSTPEWRRIRLLVWERDGGRCGLCGELIPPGARKPHPLSFEVHHLKDRRISGDDPAHLMATHRKCNQQAGQPGKQDPPHQVPAWLAARLADRQST